ncbi:MAG: MOSC domain-containing protein [Candidatus Binataceae bacterium]
MAKVQVGIVGELWRYPVKSLRGQRLREMTVTADGVLGDRAYALRDLKYGAILSAKMLPSLLAMRACWAVEPGADTNGVVRIEMPDGTAVQGDSPQAAQILSQRLALQVRLERTRSGPLSNAAIEAIRQGEAFLPQRKFFDEGPLHLLASGTLKHLQGFEDGSDFDRRRFRPNILIDTGGDADGFIEDRWLGGILEIGDAVKIADMWPAIRCSMTTYPQDELPHDPAILRAAAQHHQAYVGVFAGARVAGIIRVGDPVVLSTE